MGKREVAGRGINFTAHRCVEDAAGRTEGQWFGIRSTTVWQLFGSCGMCFVATVWLRVIGRSTDFFHPGSGRCPVQVQVNQLPVRPIRFLKAV